MAKDRNYTGTTRFVDNEDILTADFGYTGDIAFVLAPGEETTTEKFVKTTSTETGALLVVADESDIVTFEEVTKDTEGALLVVEDDTGITTYEEAEEGAETYLTVVADDAADFDAETQVKVSDVAVYSPDVAVVGKHVVGTEVAFDNTTMIVKTDVTGITVVAGKYVTKTITPFDADTMIAIDDVTGITVITGDYVKKETVTVVAPPTVIKAFVKLDRNWLVYAIVPPVDDTDDGEGD